MIKIRTIIMLVIVLSCCHNKKSKPVATEHEDMTIMAFVRDSTSRPLAVIPDELLLSEKLMWESSGEEMSAADISRLVRCNVNFLFPNSFAPSRYDLEHRFIPNMIVSIIGLFSDSDKYDSFIIKESSKRENACSFYLVTSKDGKAISSGYVGYSTTDLYHGGSATCEKLSSNTFAVHYGNIDGTVTDMFIINEGGKIAFVKRVESQNRLTRNKE